MSEELVRSIRALKVLDKRINKLTEWNSYAVRLQREYDDLLLKTSKLQKEEGLI